MLMSKCSATVCGGLLVFFLLTMPTFAQPPEATTIMDGIMGAEVVENVEFEILGVGYDDATDTLWVAALDGEHYDPTMKVAWSVPVAAVTTVRVQSHSDTDAQTDMPQPRGCALKLIAKDSDLGWATLEDEWITDGEFTVDYEQVDVNAVRDVEIGFFKCDHVRKMQAQFEKLRHQVKKEGTGTR